MSLPKDPFILLSYVNTKLRDQYSSLQELCLVQDLDGAAVTAALAAIGYAYDRAQNRFV